MPKNDATIMRQMTTQLLNIQESPPITGYKDYQSDANWIAVLANKIAAFKRSNAFKIF